MKGIGRFTTSRSANLLLSVTRALYTGIVGSGLGSHDIVYCLCHDIVGVFDTMS